MQDVICCRTGRAIRTFENDLGADGRRILHGDLLLQCRRHQNIAIHGPKLRTVADFFAAAETGDASGGIDVGLQRRHIQAAGTHHGRDMILYRHHFGAGFK